MLESQITVGAKLTDPDRVAFVTMAVYHTEGESIYEIVGTSRELALQVLAGMPVGILLDRLEECSGEILQMGIKGIATKQEIDPITLSEALKYLRHQHPNGV